MKEGAFNRKVLLIGDRSIACVKIAIYEEGFECLFLFTRIPPPSSGLQRVHYSPTTQRGVVPRQLLAPRRRHVGRLPPGTSRWGGGLQEELRVCVLSTYRRYLIFVCVVMSIRMKN